MSTSLHDDKNASFHWNILRTGSQDSGGLEIPSIPLNVLAHSGQIRLSVGPSGEARLLLPLAPSEGASGIISGEALSVDVSSFIQNGRAHRFLDLQCLVKELEPVFEDVVSEIITRVSQGDGCLDAARATLEDFRALLNSRRENLLDRPVVAGLVGELYVLNNLLDYSSGSWRAWSGPKADRHDFRVANCSLEIKTSLVSSSRQITVNGLEQLESPSGGSLNLAHIVLEPVHDGPLTISFLGHRALQGSDDPEGLKELFAAAGCEDIDSQAWNQYAFRVDSVSLYQVDDLFPRLVRSMFSHPGVPSGVREVAYKVDLSYAEESLCETGEFDSLLKRLAG